MLFSAGKLVSFDEILDFLRKELRDPKLSESSVRRDFTYMKEELDAPLEYDKKNHGWKYTKPFKFPSESFTEDEILSLHLIKALLAQYDL